MNKDFAEELEDSVDRIEEACDKVRAELKDDIKIAKQDMKTEIKSARLDMKDEIKTARLDMKEDIEVAMAEMEHEVEVLRAEPLPQTLKRLFSLTEDVASHYQIRKRILDGGKFTGTNMIVLILAILIASVGLNTGSTAVIIGAMLISPLMGNILAMAYGTAAADGKIFAQYIVGFLAKIVISIATSTVYFLLSPVKEPTTELIARTNPTFFDIIIAICGGLAGIVGQTRKDKSNNIIPGVAIATALMPPLCTCGYAIANGKWAMFLGAGYLFTVNTYFIFLSSTWVLSLLRVPHVGNLTEQQWKVIRLRMIRNALIITIPSIIAGFMMVG